MGAEREVYMEHQSDDAEHFADQVLMMELIKELVTEAQDPLYLPAGRARALRMITVVADEMINCLGEEALCWGVQSDQLRAETAVSYVSFRSSPKEHWLGSRVRQLMGEQQPVETQAVPQ